MSPTRSLGIILAAAVSVAACSSPAPAPAPAPATTAAASAATSGRQDPLERVDDAAVVQFTRMASAGSRYARRC